MSKFKVGDRVKVVNPAPIEDYKIGDTGEVLMNDVSPVSPGLLAVLFDFDDDKQHLVYDWELELIEPAPMTDDDGLDWCKCTEFFDNDMVFMSTAVVKRMIEKIKKELEDREK